MAAEDVICTDDKDAKCRKCQGESIVGEQQVQRPCGGVGLVSLRSQCS